MELQAPEDIAHGFVEAWEDRDPDALAVLFVEDADFVNVVGLWWEDQKNIRRAHARGFRVMFGSSTMRLERIKVRRLSVTIAVVHASWRMSGQFDPDGVRVGDRAGVFTFVAERRGDVGWRAVSAQNTDRLDGAETLVAGDGSLTPTSYVH
ncbi:MAG: SgcJ/EcaC family oxidoreductase [Propionibacterium sp.]|nr:SgcJ/EcaC family oxidoreductase [Propionibacterium sp.]